MTNAAMDNVKEYYRLITEIDIGLVARQLLGARILREKARLLRCDSPDGGVHSAVHPDNV